MPVGGQASKSGSKTVQLPFTEADLELLGINIDTAKLVFENLLQQQGFQQKLFAEAENLLGTSIFNPNLTGEQAQARIAQAQQSRVADETRFGQNAQLQRQLADIIAGKGISEGERGLLDQIAQSQIGNIRNSTASQLGLLKRELAPTLGLRGSDSPIVDRGGLIAQQGLFQESQVAGQRAQAELGLQQSNLQNFGNLLGINNAANQFSQSLLQGDFNAQLGFLTDVGQLGLGFGGATDIAALEQAGRPQLGTESKSKSAGGSIG